MQIDLNGVWRLKRHTHGEPCREAIEDGFIPDGWLDVRVPGDVRTALRQYGFISGHYLGKKLDDERWIDDSDWLYHRRFFVGELPRSKVYLRFQGVDTLAEIWLNGKLIGKCDNMFIPWEFDVTDCIRQNQANVLVVRILSAKQTLAAVDRTDLYPAEDTDRLILRKSQMNYGWDFCGHCLTAGLWKGVSLRVKTGAEIERYYLRTESIADDSASLVLQTKVSPLNDEPLRDCRIRLVLRSGEAICLDRQWPVGENAEMRMTLPNPMLWWPRPYGKASLYEAELTLWKHEALMDTRTFRFGIRTIELLQRPLEEGGRDFVFSVNGRELFIRGANWVPQNAVYAEITDEQTRYYLDRAVEANLTMLRVWGGGIYESELFFDLCDEKGILIMQDFMLACGILPQKDWYLQQVSKEVVWAVRHYRNRASLAIWSADNELDQAYWWYDLQAIFKTNRVNRVAVRQAVEQEDPYRPFLVSSPCSPYEDEPGGDDPNSALQGDMHVYLPRFHPESPFYYKKVLEFVPRFMSEFGFSSLPSRDSYEKFNFYHAPLGIEANPWLGELPAFRDMLAQGRTEDLLYYTQYTHAWGLKYWIEYMRSHKGTCGGCLYWKFNDPIAPNRENMLFPSLMSCIDFYGSPKLVYDYTRRVYEDVILAFREEKGRLLVFGCNETAQPHEGELTVSLMNADGTQAILWQGSARINGDETLCLADIPADNDLAQRRDVYVKAGFQGSITMENRFFPGDIAEYVDKQLLPAALHCRVVKADDCGVELCLSSDRYAQDVTFHTATNDARYSDNAFCMDAHSEKRVRVTLPKERRRELSLTVRAWNSAAVNVDWNMVKSEE